MRISWSGRLVACCLAAGLVPIGPAWAMPDPGTRIRVTASEPDGRWIGTFVSAMNDTITMHVDDGKSSVLAIPMLHTTRFEVSRGIRRNGLRGAGMGLAVFAVFGAVVGASGHSDRDYLASSASEAAAVAAIVFGILGAGVGAVVGATHPSERWRDLSLESLKKPAGP